MSMQYAVTIIILSRIQSGLPPAISTLRLSPRVCRGTGIYQPDALVFAHLRTVYSALYECTHYHHHHHHLMIIITIIIRSVSVSIAKTSQLTIDFGYMEHNA